MISHLDNLLRHLFLTQLSELSTDAQVGFQPPDEEWRTVVVNLQDVALNIYMLDLRENRKLRSNERVRTDLAGGQIVQQQAPARIDCHYLVSAWSPAQANLEPTVDEHGLLYQAAAVLINSAPLNAARVYGPGSPVLPTLPEAIRDADLPTQILPVEGFVKLAEFWGAMGTNHRWKPALYLVITLPVVLVPQISGPMVTAMITEYRQAGKPETAATRILIGGHVQRAGAPLLVALGSATVTAVNGPGTTVTVDDAAPFRAGDTITEDGQVRATLSHVQGNSLILTTPLAGLAAGDTVRIADITPSQSSFRLEELAGVAARRPALLGGEDVANPGVAVSERVVVDTVSPTTGFVTLAVNPLRTRTLNLDPAAAIVPTLTPLQMADGAWVRLEEPGGTALQTATTNADGRFSFDNLRQGSYVLRVRAPGFAETTQNIEVPATAGNYDVDLT
jgi:hypothetical protein